MAYSFEIERNELVLYQIMNLIISQMQNKITLTSSHDAEIIGEWPLKLTYPGTQPIEVRLHPYNLLNWYRIFNLKYRQTIYKVYFIWFGIL